MPDVLTEVVELAVAVACLVGAAASWRRPTLRWLATLLTIAGVAAATHGILVLVR